MSNIANLAASLAITWLDQKAWMKEKKNKRKIDIVNINYHAKDKSNYKVPIIY